MIAGSIFSSNKKADRASPKKGCNNWSCPTTAVPPCARPVYQKIKPTNMLNIETYPRDNQDIECISDNVIGLVK